MTDPYSDSWRQVRQRDEAIERDRNAEIASRQREAPIVARATVRLSEIAFRACQELQRAQMPATPIWYCGGWIFPKLIRAEGRSGSWALPRGVPGAHLQTLIRRDGFFRVGGMSFTRAGTVNRTFGPAPEDCWAPSSNAKLSGPPAMELEPVTITRVGPPNRGNGNTGGTTELRADEHGEPTILTHLDSGTIKTANFEQYVVEQVVEIIRQHANRS